MKQINISFVPHGTKIMRSFEFYDIEQLKLFFILMEFPYNNETQTEINLKQLSEFLYTKNKGLMYFQIYK